MTMRNATTPAADTRRVPVLARSFFRHMQDQGYTREQIIGVSSELLSLVSTELRSKDDQLAAE